MNIFNLLTRLAPNQIFISLFLGLVSGVISALILPLLVRSFQTETSGLSFVDYEPVIFFSYEIANYHFAFVFITGVLIIIATRIISGIILQNISLNLSSKVRTDFYDQIRNTSVINLEKIGSSNLIASLQADVPKVVSAAFLLPQLLTSSVTVIVLLCVLAYINFIVFKTAIIITILGVTINQVLMYFARRNFRASREYIDGMQESLRGLIYGFKELKINDRKCETYFNEFLLMNNRNQIQTQKMGQYISLTSISFISLFHYFLLGLIVFVIAGYYRMELGDLILSVMILLFLQGPMGTVANFIPQYLNAKISIDKINAINRNLGKENIDNVDYVVQPWQSIRLENIYFKYSGNGNLEEAFTLGPVNMEIRKGEITFIAGGNGSGKSTLSKLITLHYVPDSGDIYFGDQQVTRSTLSSLRQVIGAIYSDYYLFEKVLGVELSEQLQKRVDEYLVELRLDKYVSFKDGQFSTVSALSNGQKRRLALLVAYIEDKELYLFDEWAADQDPEFKNIFYKEIIQELKAKGKAIVVVTHDERYFACADKIIYLEDGEMVDNNRFSEMMKISLKEEKLVNANNI